MRLNLPAGHSTGESTICIQIEMNGLILNTGQYFELLVIHTSHRW